MIKLAYLFERFPSFTQTFCYREVMELRRQECIPIVFSIRQPGDGPAENWDAGLVRQVNYLPEEKALVREVQSAVRRGDLPGAVAEAIENWGRQTDFLRLYQAGYIGARLPKGIHVHAHFAGMAARTAYWVKQFFGVPFSFTAHANDIFVPRAFAIGLDRLIDTASSVVTESDYAANYLRTRFPPSAAKIQRVYNALDLLSFPRADFASPIPLIISVGRLIEKKGFSDLIAACRILADSGCNFRCEIIGEGPLENDLRAQIEGSNLREKVTLAGAQSQAEIKRRLAAATVFVLACTTDSSGGTDNLPTVIMEAMATGLPVVSTTLAGIPEMVQPGITGELVPPDDPRELARAIEQIITDPARAREAGNKGFAVAREKFSIEKNVQTLVTFFAGDQPTV
jgi:glycosyltransferase involved in cell wall biosynthesis